MESYFNDRAPKLYQGRMDDVFPQYNYEVGITPEYAIKAKDFRHIYQQYSQENKPKT